MSSQYRGSVSLFIVVIILLAIGVLFSPIPTIQTEDIICVPCDPGAKYCISCPQKGDIYWTPSIFQRVVGKLSKPGLLMEIINPPPSPPSVTPENPSQTPDPTANWKTYTNISFGFEFKLPPDWEVLDNLRSESSLKKELTLLKYASNKSELGLVDGVNLKIFPYEKYSDEEISFMKTAKKFGTPENFSYSNWQGVRFKDSSNDTIIATYKLSSGKEFQIDWTQLSPKANNLTAESYLFPILSTFKFID